MPADRQQVVSGRSGSILLKNSALEADEKISAPQTNLVIFDTGAYDGQSKIRCETPSVVRRKKGIESTM